MNLLIIGFGKIGKSHLKSFYLSKKKYDIFLYDINEINSAAIEKKKNLKFHILKKFPKNLKFELCIIATNSLERFKIIKNLIKYNDIKFFIIEKYIFTKTNHYYLLKNKLYKISNRLFINLWGSILADSLKLKLRSKYPKFQVKVKDGRLITNTIHFLDFFCFFTTRKLKNLQIYVKKIKNSKRKNYKEISGTIFAENKKGNIMITSEKNINYDSIQIQDGVDIYEIIIAKDKSCFLYKNSQLINKVKFPFAFIKTSEIFERFFLKKKKSKIFSNFKSNYLISLQIIKKLKRNILIT